MNQCLQTIYSAKIDAEISTGYWDLLGRFDIKTSEHPIQHAYGIFKVLVPTLYATEHGLCYLDEIAKRLRKPIPLTPDKQEEFNRMEKQWLNIPSNAPLAYSIGELFNFAINGVRGVVREGEAFLASDFNDCKVFFQQSQLPYLDTNWNLDTGLPCKFNDEPMNVSLNEDERFSFDVDILVAMYKRLA